MNQSRQAFVALGSNLGDRHATLLAATRRLASTAGIQKLLSSPVYETEPVGTIAQSQFLNAVIGLRTSLSPEDLLATLLATEQEFGRIRTVRWGPRSLDLDLLIYEGERRETATLTLPHPRMFERAFVFVPLRDLLGEPSFQSAPWAALRHELEAKVVEGGIRLYSARFEA